MIGSLFGRNNSVEAMKPTEHTIVNSRTEPAVICPAGM